MLKSHMKRRWLFLLRSFLAILLVVFLLAGTTTGWAEEQDPQVESTEVTDSQDTDTAEVTSELIDDSQAEPSEDTAEATAEDQESTQAEPQYLGVPQDITGLLTFANPKLEFNDGGTWTEFTEGVDLDNIFQNATYDQYRFTIDWATTNQATEFESGDYFVFKVPSEFGGRTFPMQGPTGEWGTVTIESDGTGKAVFNEGIEGLQKISGSLLFAGKYYNVNTGTKVEWDFTFDKNYDYDGESEGNVGIPDTIRTPVDLDKSGYYNNNNGDDYYRWRIIFNAKQESDGYQGKVEVNDTFGGGYKIIPAGIPASMGLGTQAKTPQPIDSAKGYYGAENSEQSQYAYFLITYIDYDGMREYYNEHYAPGILPDNTVAERDLLPGETCQWFASSMMWETYIAADETAGTIPPGKKVGDSKYQLPYTGGVKAVITEDGFTLEFPEGVAEGKCLQIHYWTDLTAQVAPEKLTNHVEVTAENDDYDQNAEVTVQANSTVNGIKNSLMLVKQDDKEQVSLGGVKFTLTKKTGPGSFTATVDSIADAAVEIKLNAPYEGTYELAEDPTTTPAGYLPGAPIRLELDTDGKIIKVNNSDLTATGLTLPGIGRITADGLVMIIYNEKAPTGSFKMQKVDSRDNTGLSGAEFRLYYTEGTDKYYATAAGSWTADVNAAKVLTTDAQGYIQVSGLLYRTYYLEEIKAPVGYQITTSTTSVVINSEQEQEVSVANDILTTGLMIQKADADEWANNNVELLDGAEFILSYEKNNTTYYYHSTNGWVITEAQAETLVTQSGKFEITGLAYGQQYTLTETKAPVGYGEDQAGRQVLIDISLTGVVTILPPPSGTDYYSFYELVSGDHVITVTNKKIDPVDFTFRKVAAENTANWLKDAKFVLYHCVNSDPSHTHEDMVTGEPGCWSVKDSQVSDADGLITFTDLVAGEYMLVETEAPDGYQQPVGQWKIVVNANHEIESAAVVGRAPAILTQKDQQGKITEYFFTNERNFQLPLTGGAGAIVFTIIGLAMVGAGVLFLMKVKKKQM